MSSPERTVFLFPKPSRTRDAHEIAFLPAALEITEAPPSPTGRAIGATIIGVFSAALLWACFGSVDIIASANGRIVPSGRTKLIQAFETGVVSAIDVRDGQKVKAGETLVELDPTMNNAEFEHLKADLLGAELEVARLRAIIAWRRQPEGDPGSAFVAPARSSAEQVETERQFLVSQTSEYRAKLSEIDRQLAQKDAERATVAAGVAKLEATVPVLQERVDVRKNLFDKALGSKLVYLTEYQDLVGMKQDISVQQSRLREAESAIDSLRETRERIVSEFARETFADLTKGEQRAAGLAQDVLKAERRTKLQKLTAPIDGVVQQLAVHTIGGVVTSAQTLAVVVPEDSPIEIEAMLANRDIGFVHAGQGASIKVDTFNFTRYGLIHGSVLNVSRDAVEQSSDGRPARSEQREASGAGGTRNSEAEYIARISLDRTEIRVDDKTERLSPGMAVTVEIKTGSRRIISYLLSPLEKERQESLHER